MSQIDAKRKIEKYRERRQKFARNALKHSTQSILGRDFRFTDSGNSTKMSEILGEFIEPYMEHVETLQSYKTLLTTAMVAWNCSLLPQNDQADFLKNSLLSLPESQRAIARNIIIEMITRKQRFFSQYRRMIVSYEASETLNGWHLSVASTLE